ncbi:hypothetical protein MTER_08430 [Mycolicibacter terrae]|uniref:Uncharacterized protein n=1 Tax=Mycolicibacter terrae TaxID=1788 RepID=A0AAD1MEK2_9MYCO|nr:hypothetical protein [Mycolicibacter terrae]ORW91351.1 hypothetical protein AWC28_18210 [Mycolicibacter terrae]BBX21432.1 hypothetical protein MTER_08430 [Mycolicibacter terrae]SNV88949.1 Uncharacterised protein [Mycolicibacter terrae]
MRSAAAFTAVLVTWFGIGLAATAHAGPTDCFDQRLCGDLGDVYYCPDTGEVVGAFGACPSLVTGPYAPGGLQPNEGLTPLG